MPGPMPSASSSHPAHAGSPSIKSRKSSQIYPAHWKKSASSSTPHSARSPRLSASAHSPASSFMMDSRPRRHPSYEKNSAPHFASFAYSTSAPKPPSSPKPSQPTPPPMPSSSIPAPPQP